MNFIRLSVCLVLCPSLLVGNASRAGGYGGKESPGGRSLGCLRITVVTQRCLISLMNGHRGTEIVAYVEFRSISSLSCRLRISSPCRK